jgi:predicted ATPase/DNA-binding SARP family transcriptional activator
VDYRLLGPVEVVSATGAPLPVAGAKLQGLVVLLALDPRSTVSSARLIDALYNDPPATVENAVQQLVSKLRRVLAEGGAPGRVVTRPPGYCLDEPRDAVDALRFERLVGDARAAAGAGDPSRAVLLVEEALGLWRGEAFAGVTLGGEAAGVRTRMAELRDAAIDDRVDWELQRGNHTAVVAELEAAVAATPLRERRWGQLMVALYRCGRQSDALRTYRQARRTLADELGVAPGPELRRLEAAVLSHDPALAPTNVPTRAHERADSRTPEWVGRVRRPRTSCLGRDTEIAQLTRLVERPGLVTLVGPGGVGKTRLAVEVAVVLEQRLPGGVGWVELTPVTPGGVGQAVGHALGFDDAVLARDGDDLLDGLARFLSGRRSAVVLDNCEHLVEEVASFVADLLDLAPGLHVVATSREGLTVEGEVLFPVLPLPLPAAVALFAERARSVGVTPADGDLVAEGPIADICRRLDSLPLSVELAAARTRHVGIGEIARRLDRPFDLLTAAPRTAVARQRSLRAVIDWSFALLGDAERELFTRLCVFENGFTLAGAEAVDPAAHAAWTLELLAGLVDKSLVVAVPDPDGGGMRYHLLETLRRYGLEQLAATSTGDAARRAHRAYFVELASAAAAGFMSSAYREWRRRVERELPDLHAACRSAIDSRTWDDALRIAGSLWWFWGSTDRHRDGRRWLEDALRGPASEADPAVRAWALAVLGYIAGQQLDLDVALPAGEEALALSIRHGDEVAVAVARQVLGLTWEAAGDHDRSAALLTQARAVFDAASLHHQVCNNDVVTCVRGLVTGDLDLVDRASREVLRRSALIDYDPHRCWAHLVRARLGEERGDLAAATAESRLAVAVARDLDLAHYLSFALARSGRVALLRGDLAHADAALTEAVAVADIAGAGWFAALARVGLADVRCSQGDLSAARALLRQAVEWGAGPAAGSARVTFYRRLAGDPVALATAALAELG